MLFRSVDSTVIRIPTSAFHALLEENPAFLQDSLCLFCDRLRQVEDTGCMAAYESVAQRLAQTLVPLAKKFGATIPLTKQELAELAHTSVETTIRILSQWKKQGIVRSSRGATTIVSSTQLTQLTHSPGPRRHPPV